MSDDQGDSACSPSPSSAAELRARGIRVFTDEFLATLHRRYDGKPPSHQVDLYYAATSANRAGLRNWIEQVVATVPEPGQAKLISRLRADEHFVNTTNELAVGAALQTSGRTVLYEHELDGGTPDWYLPGFDTIPDLIVEVWNKNHARGAAGRRRQWLALQARVEWIPHDVFLNVIAVDGKGPPPMEAAKSIASQVRGWLDERRGAGSEESISGYKFRIAGTGTPTGRARLTFPGEGGAFTTKDALDEIESKVKRYSTSAYTRGAALVVVVAGEIGTPISRGTLAALVAGQQSFEISFDLLSEGEIADVTMPMNAVDSQRQFPAVLSGIAWVELTLANEPGDPPAVRMELFPNPARSISAPPIDAITINRA